MKNTKANLESEFLQQYDVNQFERPSVAVDVLIFAIGDKEEGNARKLPEKQLKILLARRKDHPDMGKWAIPGGFVGMNESLDEAAYQRLKEKTGVSEVYLEQLYSFGEVDRDPRTRVITCAYIALVESSKVNPIAGRNTDEVAWFEIKGSLIEQRQTIRDNRPAKELIYEIILTGPEVLKGRVNIIETVKGNIISRKYSMIDKKDIAFDHAKIVWFGLERLRNKVEYTPIVFSLMPELFTLTELQQVFETILGRELLAANFRRKISNMVIPTDNARTEFQHRPAKLFRFNPDGVMSGVL